jgi:ribosomal protein L11 methyltransferase
MALIKLLLDVPAELAEECAARLIQLGAGGVEEQSGDRGARLIVYGDDSKVVAAISERARDAFRELGVTEDSGNLSVRIVVDQNSDWETAWTRYLEPQRITDRWVVQPIGNDEPIPWGTERIWIQPTLAFGDGAHVSTRLAARAVEQFCLNLPEASVLDVGTGTGVLAIVAALSGARTVVGVDVDAVALGAARENARLNGLAERIAFVDAAEDLPTGFDLVVANLPPRTLLDEARRLASRARDSRELLVTGFLSDQADLLRDHFAELGLRTLGRVDDDGWALLVLTAKS